MSFRADRWDILLIGETTTAPRNRAGLNLARKRWAVRMARQFMPARWLIARKPNQRKL